jgi:class 3 adenylate cyclase
MDLERFNRLLLESVGVGLAVVDAASQKVLFRNARMDEWFPDTAAGGLELAELFPNLDLERMAKRLDAGRGYQHETEIQAGKRKISLAVGITAQKREDLGVLLVECQNVTKLRELEYMIQSYASMVEKQNRELRKEKDRVEKVLLNIMPKTVYEEWRQFGVTTPQRYDGASILMLDFVDFTEMAISEDPPALISELNDIFTAFDRIVEQFGCERLKTIGDAYIAVSGIPEPTPDHASNIAGVALRIVRFLKRRNQSHAQKWRCRVGIATGPVVGSIVGIQKYVYDIFGPGMNLAARLEAMAEPMEIVLCERTKSSLPAAFETEPLESVNVKGFGEQQIYRLLGNDEIRIARSAG